MYEVPGLARFRVNVLRHLHGLGAVSRVIPSGIQSLKALGRSPVLQTLCRENHGVILVTGPTGSGKSTTLAALIDCINRDRKGYIVTIEDPIEFIHRRQNCLISQQEVGWNTSSSVAALHSALHEDLDVIPGGELRDLETMSLAVTAAEIGALRRGTLPANGAVSTIDQDSNVYPVREQSRIRTMLSTSLRGVSSQQLVRRADGKGRLAALEILIVTTAAANIIRDGDPGQVAGVIERGALLGMQSLEHALRTLLDAKLITVNEAYRKAVNKSAFEAWCEQETVV